MSMNSAVAEQIIELLTAYPEGINGAKLGVILGISENTMGPRLRRMARAGVVKKIGGGCQSRYFMPENEQIAQRALETQQGRAKIAARNSKTLLQRKFRAKQREKCKAFETQDLPVRQILTNATETKRPAVRVNSVWALAA